MDRGVRRATSFCVLLAVMAFAHAVAGAPADPRKDQSRAAFLRGVELVQKGDFTGARGAFVEAHKLFPHPSILLNLGVVRARLGEYVEAEQDLVRFLADDGGANADEIKGARQTLAEVRAHLGTIKVRVEPSTARATLDEKPVALAPGELAEVRVVAGDHELVFEAPGFGTERARVHVEGAEPSVVVRSLSPVPTGEPAPSAFPTRTVIGVSLLATAGTALLVSFGTGARAIERADTYNVSTSPQYRVQGVRDEGVAFRTTTDVLIVSSLLLGAAGVAVLFWPTKPAATARVSPSVGPAWVGLRGTF